MGFLGVPYLLWCVVDYSLHQTSVKKAMNDFSLNSQF